MGRKFHSSQFVHIDAEELVMSASGKYLPVQAILRLCCREMFFQAAFYEAVGVYGKL